MKSSLLYLAIITSSAALRFFFGPWYHITNPFAIIMLDGFPASWESTLFASNFASFSSHNTIDINFTEIQLRVFIPMGIAALAASITTESYWSSALVEIFGWFLATKGTEYIGRQLLLPTRVVFASSVLVSLSPLFTSQMWMHVMHLVEFSSIIFGILFVLYDNSKFINLPMNDYNWMLRVTRILRFSVALFILAHMYVYQSLIAILAICMNINKELLRARPTVGALRAFAELAFVVVSSYCIYILLDYSFVAYLRMYGINVIMTGTEIGGNPLNILYANRDFVLKSHTLPEFIKLIYDIITNAIYLIQMSYHPLVFWLSVGGAVLTGGKIRKLYLILVFLGIAASSLYHTPWTVMTAYPVVYIMCGIMCDKFGRSAASIVSRIGPSCRVGVSIGYLLGYGVLLVSMVMSTNMDILGDDTFQRQWWKLYSNTFPS